MTASTGGPTAPGEWSYPIGLEEGSDGWFLAHALSVPGCAAPGRSPQAALDLLGGELSAWLNLLAADGRPIPPRSAEIELVVEEWVESDSRVAGGESAACFAADLAPLGHEERVEMVRLLGVLRGRLLERVRRARDADLEAIGAAGPNLRTILDELARAQWWTLTRLGASPLAEIPDRAIARLDTSMVLVVTRLTADPLEPDLAAIELDGERWTPRKVLRRLLWLEWSLGGAAIDAIEADRALGATG